MAIVTAVAKIVVIAITIAIAIAVAISAQVMAADLRLCRCLAAHLAGGRRICPGYRRLLDK